MVYTLLQKAMETEKLDLKVIFKGLLGIRKCYILGTEGPLRLSDLQETWQQSTRES